MIGLFLLLSFGGWILGIVGFFRANRALSELRQLQAVFAGRGARPAPRD